MNISDPTARPGYKELSSGIANSVLSTDRAIGSVLMDTVGGYTTTYQPDPSKYSDEENKALKAGKLIVYKRDGSGNYNPSDFTPAQMADAKKAVEDNLRSQLGYEAEPVKVSGGGGSGGGPTWLQQQNFNSKQPYFGEVIKDVRGYKGKNVVAVDNASFSVGKSGDLKNVKELGYSPSKGLYIKYDEYTKVQNPNDFNTGIKKGEVDVFEQDPKFSVLLKRLGVDKSQLQALKSSGATTTSVPTATNPSEDEIKFYMKKNPTATRAQIIEGLKNK